MVGLSCRFYKEKYPEVSVHLIGKATKNDPQEIREYSNTKVDHLIHETRVLSPFVLSLKERALNPVEWPLLINQSNDFIYYFLFQWVKTKNPLYIL